MSSVNFPFNFEGGFLDLVVLVPAHCLSVYISFDILTFMVCYYYLFSSLKQLIVHTKSFL